MAKWIKTNFPGVRYREHPSRKHGIKPDRYFTIRYKIDGKDKEEGLGWSSEKWTAQKAAIVLSDLKMAQITGNGSPTLNDKRKVEKEKREEAKAREAKEKRDSITFSQYFEKTYLPDSKNNKSKRSCDREDGVFKLWVKPIIGDLPLKEISPFHLERIKADLSKAKRAPRTIHYTLAIIRQVFNHARRHRLYEGDPPTSKIKYPRADNRRLRFLNLTEANLLLSALKGKSQQVYEMALVSLYAGLRAGEIFSLTWGDVDLERGILVLRDTKSGKNRMAFMTDTIKAIFTEFSKGKPTELIFPDVNGGKIERISNSFQRVVADLKLNKDVTDPRQKVVFHTLRHTFASWLVENGVDLYTVKELMGHESLTMTERYAHLGQNTLQRAVNLLGTQMAPTTLAPDSNVEKEAGVENKSA